MKCGKKLMLPNTDSGAIFIQPKEHLKDDLSNSCCTESLLDCMNNMCGVLRRTRHTSIEGIASCNAQGCLFSTCDGVESTCAHDHPVSVSFTEKFAKLPHCILNEGCA